jgi:LuxR family transcriptional regulator, quorum-sensing system regulator SolR
MAEATGVRPTEQEQRSARGGEGAVKAWQDDQLQILLNEKDEHRVFDKLVGIARNLGFDHCAYGVRPPLPLSRQRIVMFNNYPADWQAQYARQNYLAVDPTVLHGLRSPLPAVWSDEFFVGAREFWEEARSHGLRYGWAQPCRDASGTLGMFTVARSHEELSDAEMQDKNMRLSWLTQIAHIAMTRVLIKKLVPEANIRLSSQETTVIRWTAEGKTTAEISVIMGLSTRTVTFHIGNVVKKLNASNKTAAAVRAAVLGLL